MNRRKYTALMILALCVAPLVAHGVPRPNHPGKRLRSLQQGETHIERWQPEKARSIATDLLAADPEDGAALRLSALAAFYDGDYAAAKVQAERAAASGVLEEDLLRVIVETWRISQKWVTKQSDHFVIHYVPGPDEILVDYALDTLERARTSLDRELGWSSTEKIRVEIYPSSGHFARISTLTREEIQTTGTIALCKFNRLMITSPRALVHGYGWLDTLAHEYTHFVVVKASDNTVPIWLHEGIAKHSEKLWRGVGGEQLDVSIESVLAEAQKRDHFIAFERMHPSIAKLPSAWEAHLAFAEVVSAVTFIKEKSGDSGLKDLLARMKEGADVRSAVGKVTGIRWSEFDRQWKAHLQTRKLRFRPELAILPIALKNDQGPADGDEKEQYHGLKDTTRRHMRLGDLLKNERRLKAAIVEYQKALIAEGQHAPMIGHKIGLTHLRLDQLDAARKALERVLELYPDYAPALVDMADVRLRDSQPGDAKDFAWRAVAVNPYDPRVHRILADACERLKDEQCVTRERSALRVLQSQDRRQ